MDKLKDKLVEILENGSIQTNIQYIGTVKKAKPIFEFLSCNNYKSKRNRAISVLGFHP